MRDHETFVIRRIIVTMVLTGYGIASALCGKWLWHAADTVDSHNYSLDGSHYVTMLLVCPALVIVISSFYSAQKEQRRGN